MEIQKRKAQAGLSGWRRDDMGIMVPIGGSSGEKELIRLGKDTDEAIGLANLILRGRFERDEVSKLAEIADIAGEFDVIKRFIAHHVAASLAEKGLARNEYLMGLVRMVVPSVMPSPRETPGDGHPKVKEQDKIAEETE